MIVVQPTSFTKIDFDVEVILSAAQRALENVAALPNDLEVKVEIEEDQATNRVKVASLDPVLLEVDGGSLENYKKPRTVGDLESRITFTRLFLELTDRLSQSFDAPALDAEVPQAHRMAWDVNLFGRTARHGLHLHQPRYRYNFRNRHGFSDQADRAFDELWAGDELTWSEISAMSDSAAG